MESFKLVKASHGAGGVDGINIEQYEERLKDNLYKLWNRMSSGSYFPKSVRGCGNTEERWWDATARHTHDLFILHPPQTCFGI